MAQLRPLPGSSAGTLNVSSASGTIATLNVLAGGTVNLGPGATITALNVTGGTVNVSGDGVLVGTLFTSGGALNVSTKPLTVVNLNCYMLNCDSNSRYS